MLRVNSLLQHNMKWNSAWQWQLKDEQIVNSKRCSIACKLWHVSVSILFKKKSISMTWCKTAVTPLLTPWSYCSLALSPRYDDSSNLTELLLLGTFPVVPGLAGGWWRRLRFGEALGLAPREVVGDLGVWFIRGSVLLLCIIVMGRLRRAAKRVATEERFVGHMLRNSLDNPQRIFCQIVHCYLS